MLRSAGAKFLIVGILALLMFIPLFFVGAIVDDRANYSRQAITDVSQEWGGAQLFSGPQMMIPVTEEVTSRKKRELIDKKTGQPRRDADDRVLYEYFDVTETVSRSPIFIYPDMFKVTLDSRTQERRRGIFNVPVYSADVVMAFNFPTEQIAKMAKPSEKIRWDKAQVRVFLSGNRALRGQAILTIDGQENPLEPLPAGSDADAGIFSALGDPRKLKEYRLELGVNGAQSLSVAAVGRTSMAEMTSDWPHPSFFGDFLPDSSDISDAGFKANWTIPHLARALPQLSRDNPDNSARYSAEFGVKFFQPNDFYQKSYRAARYGILFIALTFLTVLLLDRGGAKPTHPVQYIFIGLAQSVFVLLMVAYSEQIGFAWAYLLSSGAVVALLTMFGALALKMGRRTLVLTVSLIILYAVLYLILRSADYALLAGATLAFLALAGTMYLTRNEDWYGPERPKRVKAPRGPVGPAGGAPAVGPAPTETGEGDGKSFWDGVRGTPSVPPEGPGPDQQ